MGSCSLSAASSAREIRSDAKAQAFQTMLKGLQKPFAIERVVPRCWKKVASFKSGCKLPVLAELLNPLHLSRIANTEEGCTACAGLRTCPDKAQSIEGDGCVEQESHGGAEREGFKNDCQSHWTCSSLISYMKSEAAPGFLLCINCQMLLCPDICSCTCGTITWPCLPKQALEAHCNTLTGLDLYMVSQQI